MESLPVVALLDGGRKSIPTMVPTTIRNLWVSNPVKPTDQPRNTDCKTVASAKLVGLRAASSSIIALDAESDVPRVLGTFETVAVSQPAFSQSSGFEDIKSLCYSMDWKPDMDLQFSAEKRMPYFLSSGTDVSHLAAEQEFLIHLALRDLVASVKSTDYGRK